VTLLYEGEVLQLPHQIPAADAVAESEREAGRLGVLLVSRLADKAVFDTERRPARIKLCFVQ
jgi:hypothetical protein